MIVVLRRGRITERGTFDVLMRSQGDFARLYRTQFSGQDEKIRALA
jgi:ABC-type multidrug transport system fused ATPase/permease subunit